MAAYDSSLILIAAAIFFALLIERLLEVIKAIYDYLEARLGLERYWNRRAEALSRLLSTQSEQSAVSMAIKKAAKNYLSDDLPGFKGVTALSASKIRKLSIRAISKGIGVIIGLLLSFTMSINLFELVNELNLAALERSGQEALGSVFVSSLPQVLGIALTGVAMGFGSTAIHKFITALERSRDKRTADTSTASKAEL